MEDPQTMNLITTIFFIAIAAIPWLIIAVPTGRRISINGIWAARMPLATTGLIVGLVSYALLYVVFRISTAMGGRSHIVPAAIALVASFQLVESTIKASATSGQAFFFIPCISGITAATIAVLSSAVLTLMRYIDQNP